MEETAHKAYQICEERNGGAVPWLDRFVISFTDPLTFLPSFQTKFASAVDFAKAIKAVLLQHG